MPEYNPEHNFWSQLHYFDEDLFVKELKLMRLATYLLNEAHEPMLEFLGDNIGKPVQAPEKPEKSNAKSATVQFHKPSMQGLQSSSFSDRIHCTTER